MILSEIMIPVARAQFEPGAATNVDLPKGQLEELVLGIINTALVLVAVVALGFLVYGGFRYVTARGNETDVEAAKATITYALIGIVVIGIAAALVNFVVGAVIGGGS